MHVSQEEEKGTIGLLRPTSDDNAKDAALRRGR